MSTDQKSSFVAYLKKYTPIISLLSTVLGIAQYFVTENRVAIVVLAGFGAVLLIAYNIWIFRATKRSVVDPSIRLPLYSKRFKVWVHSISACLLVVCWIIVACMAWPKHSSYILYEIGLHKFAIKNLESYLGKSPEDYYAHYKLALWYENSRQPKKCIDKLETLTKGERNKPDEPNLYLLALPVAYDVYYKLAQCYKNLPDPNKYVKTLESLLDEDGIFKKKFSQIAKINEKKSEIHSEIALFLISSDYIKGIDSQHKTAWGHIEKARRLEDAHLLKRDWPPNPHAPRVFWIHGFLTAYRGGDKESRSQVEKSFDRSKSAIERIKLSEKNPGYRFYFSQHHYWFGRALFEFGEYGLAKGEFTAGLAIALKHPRLLSHLEHFYFRLGQSEYRLTGNVKTTEGYWENLSEEYYLETKLLLAGFDYWCRATRAGVEGNQDQKLKYLSQADDEFSNALYVGHNSEKLYFRLGQFYFEQKDYETASNNFKEASKKNPTMYRAFYCLGISRFMEEKFAEAKNAMNDAKQLEPKDPNVYFWSGKILLALHNEVDALKEYQRCIELDKKYFRAYIECISLMVTISENKAISSAEQIDRLEEALTYTKLGIEASRPDNDEPALSELRTLRHFVLNSLAFIYAERGEKLKRAEEYIDEALEIAKAHEHEAYPYYLDTKAWVIIKRTERNADFSDEQKRLKYMEAENILNECLKSLPRDDIDAKKDVLSHMEYLEKLVEQLDQNAKVLLRMSWS